MNKQEKIKKDLEIIVRDTCEDVRLYTNRNIEGFVTECVSAIRDYLHSKGMMIQTIPLYLKENITTKICEVESLIEEEKE